MFIDDNGIVGQKSERDKEYLRSSHQGAIPMNYYQQKDLIMKLDRGAG